MRNAMRAHRPLLVRENAKVTSRLRATKQDEFRFSIFGKVGCSVRLIDNTLKQFSSTSQAAALVAYRPCGVSRTTWKLRFAGSESACSTACAILYGL
jgi:hypothetical protein